MALPATRLLPEEPPQQLGVVPEAVPAPLYFVNGVADALLIGGGSILAFLWFRCVPGGVVAAQVAAWSGVLARVCNWPHFAATSCRLYQSRANLRRYPVTAFGIPLVVLAAAIWSFADATRVAPAFGKLVAFWSTYHFAGQSFGLSLIYARRAGFQVGRWERLGFSGFLFSIFLAFTAHEETGSGTRSFLGLTHPRLGLPVWVAPLCLVAVTAFGLLLLARVLRWCREERRLLPSIVLLPAATHFVWYVLAAGVEGFGQLTPFFHSLQYMYVAWAVQLKERLDRTGFQPSARFVTLETIRWWVMSYALALLLFQILPGYLSLLGGYDPDFAFSVVFAAVQVHHFFVDGVIWKLRSPGKRSPLLVNVDELLHAPSAVGVRAA